MLVYKNIIELELFLLKMDLSDKLFQLVYIENIDLRYLYIECLNNFEDLDKHIRF